MIQLKEELQTEKESRHPSTPCLGIGLLFLLYPVITVGVVGEQQGNTSQSVSQFNPS